MELFGEDKMRAGGWMDMAADRSQLRVNFIHFMQTIHEISFIKNDRINIFEILYQISIYSRACVTDIVYNKLIR